MSTAVVTNLVIIEDKLPHLPSELLRMAVADMDKCVAAGPYELDMGCWHAPTGESYCSICLAGAVLAQECGVQPGEGVYGAYYPSVEDSEEGHELCLLTVRNDREAPRGM